MLLHAAHDTVDGCFSPTVFMLIERKQKNNNFKSGFRIIRVTKIPGSEFSSVN